MKISLSPKCIVLIVTVVGNKRVAAEIHILEDSIEWELPPPSSLSIIKGTAATSTPSLLGTVITADIDYKAATTSARWIP